MTPNKGRAPALGLATLGAAASLLLVLGHWSAIDLPGCRADSPCAAAAASPFAETPVRGWPTAALALAFFAAWAALAAAGPIPDSRSLRAISRLALLGALAYTALALATRTLCPYCFACHAATLGLWILAERARRPPARQPTRTQWAGGLTLAALVLIGAEVGTRRAQARRDELETQAQVDLKEAFARPAPPNRPSLAGRYPLRRGPAPTTTEIEVVVFTGYQCPECFKLEAALREALATDPDTALSIRHFPFCADCNRLAKQTIHPNGCWAARAAETAGILRGADGFWAMHRWLFERRGAFTDAELAAHLAQEGYDAAAFTGLLQSDRTLDLVKQDVELAASLALNRTPTVFVDNVEVKLWNAPTALIAALHEARAARQHPATPAPADRPDIVLTPPTGLSRLLAEWREQPTTPIPPDQTAHSVGPADSPCTAVVFGDHQDNGTARLDARLRALAAEGRLRYTYRHFPADQKCNPTLPRSFHPLACRLARTAEAAALSGGEGAFWKVHAFILEHHQAYTDADLRDFAAAQELDGPAILKLRDGPEASAAVEEDVAAGKALGVAELPCLFVNSRRVPRWEWDGKDILDALITGQ